MYMDEYLLLSAALSFYGGSQGKQHPWEYEIEKL